MRNLHIWWNFAPCNGLVKTSAHMISVLGQYLRWTMPPVSDLSLTRKNLALICFVLGELETPRPFFSSESELILSWYTMFLSTLYPWASMKWCVHRILPSLSSTATSSVSVELLVLSFCFLDKLVIAPWPMVKSALVCRRQSLWAWWDLSRYHLRVDRESTARVSFKSFVPLRYFSTLFSFPSHLHLAPSRM